MTRKRAWINAYADQSGEELLVAEQFDAAIVGICRQFRKTFVVYDLERVLRLLMKDSGMTREEAEEYFEFNVVGAFVGDATPGFIIRPE